MFDLLRSVGCGVHGRSPGRMMQRLAQGLIALALATSAAAQTFPSKPIKIVVPFPPGGFNDVLGRTLAQEFQKAWNQPVVVDNRPGGNTIIASSPDQFAQHLKSEIAKWGKVVREAKIRVD